MDFNSLSLFNALLIHKLYTFGVIRCPRQQQNSKKLFFKQTGQSKGHKDNDRASLVEYACQISSLYYSWFKSYGEG